MQLCCGLAWPIAHRRICCCTQRILLPYLLLIPASKASQGGPCFGVTGPAMMVGRRGIIGTGQITVKMKMKFIFI